MMNNLHKLLTKYLLTKGYSIIPEGYSIVSTFDIESSQNTLQNTIKYLKEENEALRKKLQSPGEILKHVLKEDLSWFDYAELATPIWKQYYDNAQLVLKNPVVINEQNFIKANWQKKAMLEMDDKNIPDKARHLEKLCWMLIGLEMFLIRLSEIQNPIIQNVSSREMDSE